MPKAVANCLLHSVAKNIDQQWLHGECVGDDLLLAGAECKYLIRLGTILNNWLERAFATRTVAERSAQLHTLNTHCYRHVVGSTTPRYQTTRSDYTCVCVCVCVCREW